MFGSGASQPVYVAFSFLIPMAYPTCNSLQMKPHQPSMRPHVFLFLGFLSAGRQTRLFYKDGSSSTGVQIDDGESQLRSHPSLCIGYSSILKIFN